MKTAIIILLGLFCLSFGRVALTDGPFWCKESQRNVETCPPEKTKHFIISGDLAKPVVGECEICKDYSISSYYRARTCPKNMKKCVASGSPICAVTSTGHMVDFTDECSACGSEFKITQYFRGQCPRKNDPSLAYCGPLPRTHLMMCAMIYSPVCGTDVFGNKKTLGNACSACGSGDIVYHTRGPCEGDDELFNPRPLPVIDPLPRPIKPIPIDPILVDPIPVDLPKPIEEPQILPYPIEDYPVLKPAVEPVIEPVIDYPAPDVMIEPDYVEIQQPEIIALPEPQIAICYAASPDRVDSITIEDPSAPVSSTIDPESEIHMPTMEPQIAVLPAVQNDPVVLKAPISEPLVYQTEAKPLIKKAVLDKPAILTVEPQPAFLEPVSAEAMYKHPAKATLLRRQPIA